MKKKKQKINRSATENAKEQKSNVAQPRLADELRRCVRNKPLRSYIRVYVCVC